MIIYIMYIYLYTLIFSCKIYNYLFISQMHVKHMCFVTKEESF